MNGDQTINATELGWREFTRSAGRAELTSRKLVGRAAVNDYLKNYPSVIDVQRTPTMRNNAAQVCDFQEWVDRQLPRVLKPNGAHGCREWLKVPRSQKALTK